MRCLLVVSLEAVRNVNISVIRLKWIDQENRMFLTVVKVSSGAMWSSINPPNRVVQLYNCVSKSLGGWVVECGELRKRFGTCTQVSVTRSPNFKTNILNIFIPNGAGSTILHSKQVQYLPRLCAKHQLQRLKLNIGYLDNPRV